MDMAAELLARRQAELLRHILKLPVEEAPQDGFFGNGAPGFGERVLERAEPEFQRRHQCAVKVKE